jgi:hypothetical protein
MGRPPYWKKNTNDLYYLPQGFKNSPTLFGEALVADLSTYPEENPSCALLQYVDDLLPESHDQEKRWKETKALIT